MANQPPSLANDLLRIHKVITRGLRVGIEKGDQFIQNGFTDETTRKGYTDYVQALLLVLDAHHGGEDAIAFPAIQAKLPSAPYEKLSADHKVIEDRMHPIQEAVTAAAAGNDDAMPSLVDSLRAVNALWSPHIQIEERHFTADALEPVMPVKEQGRISGAMSKHSQEVATPGYLSLPFVLYNLEPDDRAALAAFMPPMLVNELIPKAWKEQWAPMKPFLLE